MRFKTHSVFIGQLAANVSSRILKVYLKLVREHLVEELAKRVEHRLKTDCTGRTQKLPILQAQLQRYLTTHPIYDWGMVD